VNWQIFEGLFAVSSAKINKTPKALLIWSKKRFLKNKEIYV
jgi:hypothetical protein